MTGNEVRKRFLEYFEKHHHQVVRSSSLVPADDPTLLFTNAGMVQFKRTFLGEEKRGYNRAVTSQKCVRAGGKHNDLENVGYTARHHTFFEMLGNFSFGDYFKEKAIEFAWDLLTNGYGLPADKLYASIFLDDDEAHELWQKVTGIPEERIVRFDEKDNFWSMGDTGPCGPCSEILLDRGEQYGCDRPDCKVGCECDRYLEIWNLVFMQFNRDESGHMEPLPKPSIDTGMGLERLTTIIQNKDTNYDTDLMMPVINTVEDLSEKKLGASFESDVAMKVIADHSRAAAFLIGDGVLPSNEGRGYVLRRIMRRAIRYGRNIGLLKPFLHVTSKTVIDMMRPAYPELTEAAAFITNVIENEEQRFSETLDSGLKILNETLADIRAKGDKRVPGDVIFKLYDTYGFPVDIVQDVVRDSDIDIDMAGFENAMSAQREKSRKKAVFAGVGDAYKTLSAEGFKPEFLGYRTLSSESSVVLLAKDGQEVESVTGPCEVEIVTDKTPFYGESGGQVGDKGTITGASASLTVTDTLKDPTGIIIHKAKLESGQLQKGDTVTLTVDDESRSDTALNHTATHILHYALRKVLGDHVKQAGSLVAPDRFRFDFSHFSQITDDEIERIERIVNDRIRENVDVNIEEMDAEEAFKSGATALFEEKYGDRVRVISLAGFSKELCGGTHTTRTGNIGLFTILSESSVAAGVRRIEAVTGKAAVAAVQEKNRALREAGRMLKEQPLGVVDRLGKVLSRQKSLEKEVEQLKSKLASASAEGGLDVIKEISGVKVFVKKVAVDNPGALRDLADKFRDRVGSGVVALGAALEGKAMITVVVTKDLTSRFKAGDLVKKAAAVVGGSGGGRPDMAQAGGPDPDKLDEALELVYSLIEQG